MPLLPTDKTGNNAGVTCQEGRFHGVAYHDSSGLTKDVNNVDKKKDTA
jgi:hypothetical protein